MSDYLFDILSLSHVFIKKSGIPGVLLYLVLMRAKISVSIS